MLQKHIADQKVWFLFIYLGVGQDQLGKEEEIGFGLDLEVEERKRIV